MNKKLLIVLMMAFLSACGQSEQPSAANTADTESKVKVKALLTSLNPATQADIDDIALSLDIKYALLTNRARKHCDPEQAEGSCFEVALKFTATAEITVNNWVIYFSQITPVQSFESENFTIEHLNGDLHRISLKQAFTGFKAGETKTLLFRANFWMLAQSDALPNYLVTADNLQARTIVSTQTKVDPDTGLELLPFVVPFTDSQKQFKKNNQDQTKWLNSASLYARNERLDTGENYAKTQAQAQALLEVSKVIIPTPKVIEYDENNRLLDIGSGLMFNYGNVNEKSVHAAIKRIAGFGIDTTTGKNIKRAGVPVTLSITANKTKKVGSYSLDITDDGIMITGVDDNGVFNGLQSLASLITPGTEQLPLLSLVDEPHYAFRGLLVDVARNFHSKAFILALLEQMSAYKLNKLHLHLGDDEGWRLEIPGLPELTDLGSKRCFDPQEQECLIAQLGGGVDASAQVNGYYSVEDYQEILRFASARFIQVIPSLDMPGHSRAAIKAMTARYNHYSGLEEYEKAKQFQLHDPEDKTQYSSVQHYNDNTINVCLESSYAFVTEVMTQVKAMHAEAEQPLSRYHIGADETAGAWLDSQRCKDFIANDPDINDSSELGAYFIERVAAILAGLDIETAAWSDGLAHTRKDKMPVIVQANAWGVLPWGGHQQTHELANRNWQIVVSTPDVMYFDFPYEADPKEHGYYWASRQTNTEKVFQFMPDNLPVHAEFWLDREDNPYTADDTFIKDKQGFLVSGPLATGRKFLGLQGQLWSENTRDDVMAEHKIFPRLLALAERAWYLPDWAVPYNYQGFKYSRVSHVFDEKRRKARDEQWQRFATTLGQKEFTKLELANIHYRLPTVGAVIKAGVLHANIAFPGLKIEYQLPGQDWQGYQGAVKLEHANIDKVKVLKVRSISKNGKRRGRTTLVYQAEQ